MICRKCHKEAPDGAVYCPYCGAKLFAVKTKPRRPNGLGTVYKAKEKRSRPWRATIEHKGKRYALGYFRTEAEAQKALLSWTPPTGIARPTVTLGEVYSIVAKEKADASKSTRNLYKTAWTKLSHLSDVAVVDLHTADFQKVIDDNKGKSRAYYNQIVVVIHAIYDWAIANELCTVNPASYLKLPKQKKKDVEIFTAEEIERIGADGSPIAQSVLVMIYTGLRIGELFALKPQDVHLNEDGYNYIVGGEKTEAGKNRTVIIHPRILPILTQWKAEGKEYLFTTKTGKKMYLQGYYEEYYPLLKRLGIPQRTPHKCRHTFASLLSAGGAEQTATQRLMGHANFATTANIYTHPDLKSLSEAIAKIPVQIPPTDKK